MKFATEYQAVKEKLFINGEYVSSKGGKPFDVINPADESVIGQSVAGSEDDVNFAVQSARKAFDEGPWRSMNPEDKVKILLRFADLMDRHHEWLSYFQTLNSGKTLALAESEITYTAGIYRHFAGLADKITGKTLPMSEPFFGLTRKEPIGVVAQIIPWNYPLMMMCWKVAPALAAGCTIVLKPAEQTPLTAMMLGRLFNEAGLPPGVINIVPGFGETGAALSQHKLVDKISFTGSTEVGYILMKNSHKHSLRPLTLELGGKSANIILPDADLSFACEQACILFGNNGQSCVAGSRTFVHESVYDHFVELAQKKAEAIKVGDPFDKESHQGAIISKEQFDKILNYIEVGKSQGAKLITGGHRIGDRGFFIKPTIFAGVEDEMTIAKEQIFGPVMCILKWKDQEEVIKRANSLPYGLGAGIVTKDISKMFKFSEQLRAGTVYVNCYDYAEGITPFGGVKDSGFGKDLGAQGLQSYLVTKTVIFKKTCG